MGQIIFGIAIAVGGIFMVLKTEWLMSNFGRIAWFEDKLGAEGGSRLGYKLIGIIAIFVGLVFATGSGSSFMEWMLSPLIKAGR
ncbi:MAG: hypothetical protein ACOYL8_02215 [Patescibacteria group bacterium]